MKLGLLGRVWRALDSILHSRPIEMVLIRRMGRVFIGVAVLIGNPTIRRLRLRLRELRIAVFLVGIMVPLGHDGG